MTIKRRLSLSNVLMIIVPVAVTALIGIVCIGIIWLAVINGAGLGLTSREDFERASMAVAEIVEHRIEDKNGAADAYLSSFESMLDENGMTMTVTRGGESIYSHGERLDGDERLSAAAAELDDDSTLTLRGRSLYVDKKEIGGEDYIISIFGGNTGPKNYSTLKAIVAVTAGILALTILLSVFITNRFLTRFVFRSIAAPLDILTNGVHEIRDGNLEYRIDYKKKDEFKPVCEDFNAMAEQLKASVDRIMQQEQSRRELIAGISHDIRSPLTSVQAYVEGLLDGVAKTPEARQRYLETIKAKAGDMERIVSQLFLFSKMDLGEFPENVCLLRLDEVIGDAVASVRDEYAQKGLSISAETEPVSMRADPVQLRRIIMNILENSLKYKTSAHGHTIISLKRTESGCTLSIKDDGPGVPPEALPHLFEVFYRSDPARSSPERGSGLGLAIVEKAVEHMGGTIQALPCEPHGLEIRIKFPNEVIEDGEDPDS